MITWTRSANVTTVAYRYAVAADPIPTSPRSTVFLVPDVVRLQVTEGRAGMPKVEGGRLLKNGCASALMRYERPFWSDDEQPDWLAAIIADAVADFHARTVPDDPPNPQ